MMENKRKEKQEKRDKQTQGQYHELRRTTKTKVRGTEERAEELGDELDGLDKQLRELEENKDMAPHRRDIQKRFIAINMTAAEDELEKLIGEYSRDTRKLSNVKRWDSMRSERKHGETFNALVKKIPDLDVAGLEKIRDATDDKMAEIEEAIEDVQGPADMTDFSAKVDLKIQESEKRQQRYHPSLTTIIKPSAASSQTLNKKSSKPQKHAIVIGSSSVKQTTSSSANVTRARLIVDA